MTTNFHTAVATGAAAQAATINSPLEELDAAITALNGNYLKEISGNETLSSGVQATIATVDFGVNNVAAQLVLDLCLTKDTSEGYAVKAERHALGVRLNSSGDGSTSVTAIYQDTMDSISAGFFSIGAATVSVTVGSQQVEVEVTVTATGTATNKDIDCTWRLTALSNLDATNITIT